MGYFPQGVKNMTSVLFTALTTLGRSERRARARSAGGADHTSSPCK